MIECTDPRRYFCHVALTNARLAGPESELNQIEGILSHFATLLKLEVIRCLTKKASKCEK